MNLRTVLHKILTFHSRPFNPKIACRYSKNSDIASAKIVYNFRILCFAHLLGWMGFLCVVLFFTDFVGQSVYGGDPIAPAGTLKNEAYKRGVEIGSWGMAINAAASSLYCCKFCFDGRES